MEEAITTKDAKKLYAERKGKIIGDEASGYVVLKNINKIYSRGNQAVFDLSLSIDKGEFVALVGPSGCGKSTTLRMIAGLETITSGEFYINNVLSNYVESKDRDIAMVFQSYALYPQMNVFDNIAFGLKIKKVDKKVIEEKVFEAAKILNLGEYLDRYPRELSGGQMQRVALGRCIVRDASIFLLDEPLSNLDAKLRVSMRNEIVKIHESLNATTIYVTHDQVEAMTMADRIVIMNKGFVQQIGEPMEVYLNPNSLFVASFIGTPMMNLFDADYKDGKVDINIGETISLKKERKESIKEFYRNHLEEVKALKAKLEEKNDEENLTDCNNYLYSLETHHTNENIKELKKKVKKKNIFKRFAALFKNKKQKEEEQLKFIEETKAKLDNLIAYLEKACEGEGNVVFGLRPEDILISEKETKHILHVNQVELLGNEFNVYGTMDEMDIHLKANGLCNIKSHSDIYIDFALDKGHIFDKTLGLKM